MKTENFFDAMGLIDERYKTAAIDFVGTDAMPIRVRKSYRRLIALAAAVALLLALGIAAYAGGWFGLLGLEIDKSNGRSAISMQGLSDSPEYKAGAEWWAYEEQLRDNDAYMDGFDYNEAQELQETYGAYGCYTREQADKLQSIADKYSLRLLSGFISPADEKAYYKAAGTGRLLALGGEYYNEYLGGYIYGDGSFKLEGALHGAQDYAVPYSMIRSVKGTLTTIYTVVDDIDSFEDWTYTAADGTEVGLSNSEGASFIIYDSGTAFIVIHILHDSWADHNGDGRFDGIGDEVVSFTLQKEELERIADCFCLSALSDPDMGMDQPFTRYERETVDPAELIKLDESIDLSAVDEHALYYVKLAIEQSIAPYISDIELVDYSLDSFLYRTMGWIEFTGVPKEELDWDCVRLGGKNLYCRSLNLIDPDNCGEWRMGTPFDMQPYHPLSLHGADDVYYAFDNQEKLRNIASASLYVPDTGETYELSTAQELDTLSRMLDHGCLTSSNGCLSWNPLYLRFKDGSTAVAYANGDGSNYVNLSGVSSAYGLGVSIFELFGVPLEAAGYTRNGALVTTRTNDPYSSVWHEMDYTAGGPALTRRVHDKTDGCTRWRDYTYDDAERLICVKDYEADGSLALTQTYTYNELGQLTRSETYSVDRIRAWCSYFYDEQGRLIREEHNDDDSPPDYTGGWVYYSYDSDGTCHLTYGFDLIDPERLK